jgi:hypothetical protein
MIPVRRQLAPRVLHPNFANLKEIQMASSSDEQEVLASVGETLGAAAGKVVSAARHTASTLSGEKRKLVRAASKARSNAKRVLKKTAKKTKKAAGSAKRAASSAKKSVKRAARRLKRR